MVGDKLGCGCLLSRRVSSLGFCIPLPACGGASLLSGIFSRLLTEFAAVSGSINVFFVVSGPVGQMKVRVLPPFHELEII